MTSSFLRVVLCRRHRFVCVVARGVRPRERSEHDRRAVGYFFLPSKVCDHTVFLSGSHTHTHTHTHTPTYNGFFGSVSGSQRRGRGARMRTARVVGGWPPVAVRDSRAAILDFCVADVTSSLFTSHYLNKLICWEYCITRTSSGLPPPLSTSPVKE